MLVKGAPGRLNEHQTTDLMVPHLLLNNDTIAEPNECTRRHLRAVVWRNASTIMQLGYGYKDQSQIEPYRWQEYHMYYEKFGSPVEDDGCYLAQQATDQRCQFLTWVSIFLAIIFTRGKYPIASCTIQNCRSYKRKFLCLVKWNTCIQI